MKRRILTISILFIAAACRDAKPPTDLAGPPDPSKIISDGAHGGNKDFFFLPPMVPLPINNPDFELGKFNGTLRPNLRIDICELKAELQNGVATLPKATTACVTGAPLKTFAPGTVNVVNLPLKQTGWWTLFNLPPDGFYYALWDTRQSNLNVNKYYRIKVFIDGATEPLGVADVDPMANLLQWKYTLTGQVIQLVDDVMLPIAFRVEKGGGSALCGTSNLCFSTAVSNSSPTGSQTVTVDGGGGSIAGVTFPNGWLPANGPQNVVVTVAQVDIGSTDPVTGVSTKPCHAGLPLQQFPGCFNFTTTPHLAAIDESGRQFATDVTVAVCYSLQGSGDPREKFAEMYASGPNEPPHALRDASDAGILSAAARNCSTTPVIGALPSHGLTRFATASWRSIKSGVGALFGVRTAYGVDLGLGGFVNAFSNIGPALEATIQPIGSTELRANVDDTISMYVRLTGSNHHDGQHENSVGLSGLTVHFDAVDGGAGISPLGETPGAATQLDVVTNSSPIDPESPVSGGGYAAVNYRTPSTPGTYHLSVNGPALGGPITFSVTVTAAGIAAVGLVPFTGYDASTTASAINSLGHIVGTVYSETASLPVLWVNAQPQSLGRLGELHAYGIAISEADEVVGYGDRGTDYYAFRSRNATMSDLGSLPGLTESFATAINSAEQIVGFSYDPLSPSTSLRGWIWQNGTITDLGNAGHARNFQPYAINDAGQIAGNANYLAYTEAYLWQEGTFTQLPGLSFLGTTGANAINATGVVVGYSSLPLPLQGSHAVVWRNGQVTDLGVLSGDTWSSAADISDDGRIVGTSGSEATGITHAVLWQNGQMIQLPTLGGDGAVAGGINAHGDIVGYSTGSDGKTHATVWHVPATP